MTEIEKIKLLTGETNEQLVALLYDSAVEHVLAYTNRSVVPESLFKTVRDIAVIMYNRRGTEGETSRSEAGERYVFADYPRSVTSVLNQYKLARINGVAYEDA